MTDFEARRDSMVEHQISGRGIDDERLLRALRQVPRERFVPVRLRELAPFEAESVAAAGPDVPRPLLEQLAVGGRLVIPLGSQRSQELVCIVRRGEDDYERQELGGVRFVPLVSPGRYQRYPTDTSRMSAS